MQDAGEKRRDRVQFRVSAASFTCILHPSLFFVHFWYSLDFKTSSCTALYSDI
jgi:hypothetical protein